MAIEYLFNAIRVPVNEDISIIADIDKAHDFVDLILLDDEGNLILSVEGEPSAPEFNNHSLSNGIYENYSWSFFIRKEWVKGLTGRYWYKVVDGSGSLELRQPIYFVKEG